jgi:linearmycin/streptolysin S transport system ATP-binding protein
MSIYRVPSPIAVEELSKTYGARTALCGVSFAVGCGEIVGLLGPNGAGKSTTLGILATLLPFDSGRVTIAGHSLPSAAAQVRGALGLVPQQLALYPTLSARENLRFFARSAGLRSRDATAATARALGLVGLDDRADEPVGRLSGGMKRRLNLACGVFHRPRVVLLDEATVGVDPQSRERVLETVSGLARHGAAVLYSTHVMEEAERLCGRVVLLDRGRVVASGTPAALVAGAGLVPRVHLSTARPLATGWLTMVAGARVIDHGTEAVVEVTDPSAVPAIVAAALRAGEDVRELTFVRPTLADAFFALTGHGLRDGEEAAA